MRIAIDIGGTFTDVVVHDDEASGKVSLGKSPTTPSAMAKGLIEAVRKSDVKLSDCSTLLHGTTAVINALIERSGAKTALVTTKGFRDIYEIGRTNRPESYNLFFKKHVPLVPRRLCFEVEERMRADGSVFMELDEENAREVVQKIADERIQALAIVFLHSYKNPVHEQRMKEIAEGILNKDSKNPVYICTSSEIVREYREYERTSTTVANAFVGPKMSQYVGNLQGVLQSEGFKGRLLFMQSNGGLYESNAAKLQPIQMIESGPAGGVAGTSYLSKLLGFENTIAFDMGGTTAKACAIEGGIPSSGSEYYIGGYNSGLVVRVPFLDIKEVGAGGGSIARVDQSNRITVGPQSAGADPGPACYGKGGTEPTVTDADILLGRIEPTHFLGGEMILDRTRAERATREQISSKLGVSLEEAAQGILSIADYTMAYAIRSVTTERGLDPRDFILFAYGGAGPTHIAPVAEELQIPLVVIPQAPAHFSATGMLLSDLRRDVVQTYFVPLTDASIKDIEEAYNSLEETAKQHMDFASVNATEIRAIRSADMRYVGQEHSVLVQLPSKKLSGEGDKEEIKKLFDATHFLRYAHNAPEERAELVNLRLTLIGTVSKPAVPDLERGVKTPPREAELGSRKIYFSSIKGFTDCPVYKRERMLAGNLVQGPAVVEEYASTIPLPPSFELEVEKHGNLYIRPRSA